MMVLSMKEREERRRRMVEKALNQEEFLPHAGPSRSYSMDPLRSRSRKVPDETFREM